MQELQCCGITASRTFTDTKVHSTVLRDLRAYTKIVINCDVTRVCLTTWLKKKITKETP